MTDGKEWLVMQSPVHLLFLACMDEMDGFTAEKGQTICSQEKQ
jgi:hypothetical protein